MAQPRLGTAIVSWAKWNVNVVISRLHGVRWLPLIAAIMAEKKKKKEKTQCSIL
jgi:hypothetical protein